MNESPTRLHPAWVAIFLTTLLITSCTKNRQVLDRPQPEQSNGIQQSPAQKPEPAENQDRHDFSPPLEVGGNKKPDLTAGKPKQGEKAVTLLYTDAEIEKLARNQLDTLKKDGTVLLLDVVPAGDSHPRS